MLNNQSWIDFCLQSESLREWKKTLTAYIKCEIWKFHFTAGQLRKIPKSSTNVQSWCFRSLTRQLHYQKLIFKREWYSFARPRFPRARYFTPCYGLAYAQRPERGTVRQLIRMEFVQLYFNATFFWCRVVCVATGQYIATTKPTRFWNWWRPFVAQCKVFFV